MDCIVTGCKDCPLHDRTGSEYGIYCHHTSRPGILCTVNPDQIPIISTMPDDEKKKLADSIKAGESRTNADGIWVEELKIEDDDNYIPITPDWCPLKKEPFKIIMI